MVLVGDEAGAGHHLAAAAAVAGLRNAEVLRPAAAAGPPEGPPGILLVTTPLEDRAYRAERALLAGWGVLAPAPVVPAAARARQLADAAATGGGHLLVEASCLWAGFAADASAALGELGVVDYVRLQIEVPRTWLAEREEGVLETEALWAPWLLERLLGPIDTVAAHTRALVRNRPTEDMAVAHLEFARGVEGALEVHALGDDGVARVSLHAFGVDGQVRLDADLHEQRAVGFRRQLEALRDSLGGGTAADHELALDAQTLGAALSLTTWIRQSARLGRRLPRRERPSS